MLFRRFLKPRKVFLNLLGLPIVSIRALRKDEFHIAKFYFDRHIIKPLGLYRFRNTRVKDIARGVDEVAQIVIGADHDTYSGATAAEVASGFDICVESLKANNSKISYLEIGSAKGKSMALIGMLSKAHGADFLGVSLDPYFDDAYDEGADQPDRFLANKGTYTAPIDLTSRGQAIALWDRLNLQVQQIRETSTVGLEHLSKQGKEFNLVYIDGLHDGLMPITDFIGAVKLMELGGVIILDDRHWANVHYLRKICDNTPGMNKIFEKFENHCIRDSRQGFFGAVSVKTLLKQ